MVGAVNEIRRHGAHDRRKFLRFAQPTQDAVAGRGVGEVNHSPFPDGDHVPAVLAHHALVILVRTEILLSDRGMENRREQLAVALVSGGDAGVGPDAEDEHFLQMEAAGQFFGRGEVQRRSETLSFGGRAPPAAVLGDEFRKCSVHVKGKAVEQNGKIDLRGGRPLPGKQTKKTDAQGQNNRRRRGQVNPSR